MRKKAFAMLQNLQVQDSLVVELIETEEKLKPLETRKEELKDALRAFGANTYPTPIGTVTVAEPSIRRKTGTKAVLNESRLEKLSQPTHDEIFKVGLISYEDVFSRQAKSAVSVTLP